MPEPRWGLTVPFSGVPLAAHEPLVHRVEAAGYADLWSADTNGADAFSPLVLAAAWTEQVRLGTGIVGVFTRGRAALAQQAAALADASNGRFVLGLGSSSDVIVEQWNGIPFARPRTRVRETVESLRPILRGERGPGGFPAPETHRLWRWSQVAAWYEVRDPVLDEAGPTTRAVNGWLALREVVPELAPDPRTLIAVLTRAVRATA